MRACRGRPGVAGPGQEAADGTLACCLLRLKNVTPTLHCPALLAIECEHAGAPKLITLERDAADRFGAALAADLTTLFPGIEQLDLVCVGALYDPAEILRPGWPVHSAMGELHARMKPQHPGSRVMALGAQQGHMGMPALDPDPHLHGGALLLMPWLLRGNADDIAAMAATLEADLLDRGMAGAGLALDLRELLGFPIQHVRHMTLFDLCALTCSQYEHAGLGALWELVEAALLEPEREKSVTLPDGSSLRYQAGRVETDSSDARQLAFSQAVLSAHGLSLTAPSA